MAVVASVLQMVWGLFQVEMPLLGISYGTFTIGLFVVHLSISLLFPLLGIGSSITNDVGRGIRHSRISSARNRSAGRKSSGAGSKISKKGG